MRPTPPRRPPIFHRRGVAHFYFMNDRMDWDTIERHFQAFAAARDVSAICFHPRNGLLLPYGGADWFDLIRRMAQRAAALNLKVWLYDEDPFPSGNHGGRIVTEYPEFGARGINLFTFDPAAQGDPSLFCFPTGPLLWCGLVNERTGEHVDLTSRVGVVRRQWDIHERWDSRFFYPDTPRYPAPMASTKHPEYALRVPPIPAGMKLVACVARRGAFAAWGQYDDNIDSLNPAATRVFLATTHEQYYRAVGDLFGKEIEAIFTDEPKFFDGNPWTPGLLVEFQRSYGYDLRPYLHYLFNGVDTDRAVLTRLQYREHVAQRFLKAWLQPVARWCRGHGIKFVGHISPEDDPVEQSICVGNLLPLMKEFDLCGIDIIIPAAGDHRHPVLSIGVTCATSIAHQQNKAGVLTETGAWSVGASTAKVGRILLWQSVLGVTTPLLHAAFHSRRGPRDYERPDFGPDDAVWPALDDIRRQVAAVQETTHGARQVAPVALLWPIRSFNAVKLESLLHDPTGLRQPFTALLAACLERQVGTHIVDEDDLPAFAARRGQAVLGQARYTHLVVPACTVLRTQTVRELRRLQKAGVQVLFAGRTPTRVQTEKGLAAADLRGFAKLTPRQVVAKLPRLVALRPNAVDVRCTAWESPARGNPVTRLLINLGAKPYRTRIDGRPLTLAPGVVYPVR